ncbi:MAG: PASTA domain-containing protein [Erysipelotrichaceae bacterium]|nr:PASTA domain-containing protein [Erysipelotrichaceae bacterium]
MKKVLILSMIVLMISACSQEKETSSTVVEEFVGHSVQDIYEWCGTIPDEYSCEITYEDNGEYEKDIVFEQSVKAGKKLKEDIYFKVSNGNSTEIALPYITKGVTKADIEEWKEATGLKSLEFIYEENDEIEKNHVIRMEPEAHVTKDTSVKVYLSSGPAAPEQTTIEIKFGDFIGLTVEEFEQKAKELGLKPNHQENRDRYNADVKFGNIAWHGSGVYEKDEVFNYGVCINAIVVNPSEYVGKTEEEFIKIAKNLHLTPKHISGRDTYSASIDKGDIVSHGNGVYVENEEFKYGLSYGPAVVSQGYEGAKESAFLDYLKVLTLKEDRKTSYSETVPAGKIISYHYGKYSTGDCVTYYVSLGPEKKTITVPDFSGKDEEELLNFFAANGILVKSRTEEQSLLPKGKIISNDHGEMKAGTKAAYKVSLGPAVMENAIIEAFATVRDEVSAEGDYEKASFQMHRYLFGRGFMNYEIVPVVYGDLEPGILVSITINGELLEDYPVSVPIDAEIVCRITSNIE